MKSPPIFTVALLRDIMIRSFSILLLFICFTVSLSANFCPAEETLNSPPDVINLEKRYQQAKFYYNELQTNTNLGATRDNWLNGVRNFRKIYLSGSKSDFAAPCLFMLGRMYAKMADLFDTNIDLKESISYYREVSELFPDDHLADDALYATANLYLNKEKNPEKAAMNYARIIARYKDGDMYVHASDKLKKLSKEYNIAVPASMLKDSYLETFTNVLPVKYWSSNNYTRVVINASRPVTYHETLLEKSGDKPRRLYLDFQNSYIEPRYRTPVPIEDGLLKQIRTGQFTPEIVRVVLDIESISSYEIFSLPDPFRVIIDVRGDGSVAGNKPAKSLPTPPTQIKESVPTKESTGSVEVVILKDFKKIATNGDDHQAGIAETTETSEQKLSLAQQLGLGVRIIVLDPGHGGKDPGASAFGLKEKNIVLKIAKKLAPILAEKTGAEIILTRDSDIFIPLEERTAIANTNEADLFISLHINAHPSPNIHGLETYYLNLSTNADAMRVAAFENATSTHQMSDLQDILSDIMKNSKINESSRLAGFVHNSLCEGMKSVEKASFKNLGVKQAPFYVLIGAEMPAILIEVAFITNPIDYKQLRSEAFLDVMANKIVQGVQSYIHSTAASL